MKKIIAFMAVALFALNVSAQKPKRTVQKTTKKTAVAAAKTAAGGFKSTNDIFAWLDENDNKTFTGTLQGESATITISERILSLNSEVMDLDAWKIKKGVATNICPSLMVSIELNKEKNTIKLIPRVGDPDVFTLK